MNAAGVESYALLALDEDTQEMFRKLCRMFELDPAVMIDKLVRDEYGKWASVGLIPPEDK